MSPDVSHHAERWQGWALGSGSVSSVEEAPRAADRGPAPSLSVLDVCRLVERTVDDAFPDEVWVRGVLSGITRSAAGHVYFDLVDPIDLGRSPEAVLPVALFANAKQRVNAILRRTNATRMDDGVEVRIRGKVAYYPRQGRVQLIMSLIDPAFTLGQLEAAKAVLLAELAALGVLDTNRRLPFPVLPLRIGLVTSAASAAEADFLTHLEQSGHPFTVVGFDTRVQGDGAVGELVAAITEAGRRSDLDVVCIVRGGGARTDLVAFDHRDVALAVAACPIPVMVGIGHEIDTSVIDSVAAVSTKTPTACAAHLIQAVDDYRRILDDAHRRLVLLTQNHLDRHRQRISLAAAGLHRLSSRATRRHHLMLELASPRLTTSVSRTLERARHRLETAELRISAVDPAKALERGWSITHTTEGTLVRTGRDVAVGTGLVTTLARGRIMSTVTETSDA